jgi:hypothetical protein
LVEATQVNEIPIDDPSVSSAQFKEARADGKLTVDPSEAEQAPKITGDETSKEYKEKRQEQQEKKPPSKWSFDKRIGRLVKQAAIERERAEAAERRLAEYESQQANRNGTHQEESLESLPEERHSEPERTETQEEDPKIREMRERHPDWDRVFARAKNEGLSISPEAAAVMPSLPNHYQIRYMLAKDDEFRKEFNKLSPQQQIKEIQKIDGDIAFIESGGQQDADRFKRGMAEASKKHSDFKELSSAAKEIKIPETMTRQIISLENGPDVAIYLARNPQIARELAGMEPRASERELWRISGQVEAGHRPKLVSQAPPPIRPVSGGSSRSTVPLDEADMTDYKKRRRAGEK